MVPKKETSAHNSGAEWHLVVPWFLHSFSILSQSFYFFTLLTLAVNHTCGIYLVLSSTCRKNILFLSELSL